MSVAHIAHPLLRKKKSRRTAPVFKSDSQSLRLSFISAFFTGKAIIFVRKNKILRLSKNPREVSEGPQPLRLLFVSAGFAGGAGC